ncbi:MAG: hypothetical protein R2827_08755 [Bdellovibrionales bacterium]
MQSERCYCAFCKHERRVYTKKHISFVNFLLSILASATLMFAIWQSFDARVVILFALSLIVAEIFITIRWRVTLPCPHCGFDPILYVRDPKKACEKVNNTIGLRRQQSNYLMRGKNPTQYLARRSKPSVKEELERRTQENTSLL